MRIRLIVEPPLRPAEYRCLYLVREDAQQVAVLASRIVHDLSLPQPPPKASFELGLLMDGFQLLPNDPIEGLLRDGDTVTVKLCPSSYTQLQLPAPPVRLALEGAPTSVQEQETSTTPLGKRIRQDSETDGVTEPTAKRQRLSAPPPEPAAASPKPRTSGQRRNARRKPFRTPGKVTMSVGAFLDAATASTLPSTPQERQPESSSLKVNGVKSTVTTTDSGSKKEPDEQKNAGDHDDVDSSVSSKQSEASSDEDSSGSSSSSSEEGSSESDDSSDSSSEEESPKPVPQAKPPSTVTPSKRTEDSSEDSSSSSEEEESDSSDSDSSSSSESDSDEEPVAPPPKPSVPTPPSQPASKPAPQAVSKPLPSTTAAPPARPKQPPLPISAPLSLSGPKRRQAALLLRKGGPKHFRFDEEGSNSQAVTSEEPQGEIDTPAVSSASTVPVREVFLYDAQWDGWGVNPTRALAQGGWLPYGAPEATTGEGTSNGQATGENSTPKKRRRSRKDKGATRAPPTPAHNFEPVEKPVEAAVAANKESSDDEESSAEDATTNGVSPPTESAVPSESTVLPAPQKGTPRKSRARRKRKRPLADSGVPRQTNGMNGDAAAEDSTDEEAPPLNGHNNVNRDRTDDNESNSAPSSAVSMLQNTKPLLTNGNGSVTVAPTDDSTTPNPSSPKKPRIEAPPLPKPVRDYGRLPQLDNVRRQPRVGDLIAYRQLEIGEDCCPRVSEWKEANVLSYDPLTCVAMLKLEAWALTPLVKPRASFGLVVGVNGDPEYDEDDEDDDEGGWVDENVTIDIRELTELKKVA